MRRAPGEESLCKEGASPPLFNHLVFLMHLDHSGSIIPNRRRASISRSAATYIYRRPPIAPSGRFHAPYKSPTLWRASPSVGPSILPTRGLRVSHNSCLTSRAQPAPSRHIFDMVVTSIRMKLSPMPLEGGPHHCSRSAAFSRFE
jgi:hypothetical protein